MQINSLQTPFSAPLSYTFTLSLPQTTEVAGVGFPTSDLLALEQPEMPANVAAEFLTALLFSLGETLGNNVGPESGGLQSMAGESAGASPCCCKSASPHRQPSAERGQRKPAEGKAPQPAKPSSKTGDRKAEAAAPTKDTSDKSSDPELASKIDAYLEEHGSPGAGSGNLFVESGQKHNVDPLLLLAIAGHETGYGTLGIGENGMLGVGAYDDNPENALTDPQFAGIANQLNVGGRTFAHWRKHFGGSPDDSIEEQVVMVGQKWATDPNWHNGVMRHYAEIQKYFG
jgi:hypothetical protein